jgi:RNA polymerase sigma-70 factor, ECF subfamily
VRRAGSGLHSGGFRRKILAANRRLRPYWGQMQGQMLFQRTDSDLVRSAVAGDRTAFAELLRPDYRAAFRLAYGLLQDVQEAEDVVQEAAFSAWKRIGNLREGAPLRPWFLGIVANQCRSVKRARWWSVLRTEVPEREAPATDVAASIDLRRALRRLGHHDRLVIVLRYYLDMPIEEVASTLGVSPKAARTRVERAVRRLRPIMHVQGALV